MSHPAQVKLGEYIFWLLLVAFLLVSYLAVVGPLTTAVALWSWRLPYKRKQLTHLAILSVGLLTAYFIAVGYSLSLWLLTLPLFPFAYLWQRGILLLAYFTKPTTLEETTPRRFTTPLHQAEAYLLPHYGWTQPQAAQLRIGRYQGGDLADAHAGFQVVNGCVTLDDAVLNQHLFLLGASGAGKTEAIKRLIYELAASTPRHIFLIDGKGEAALGEDLRAIASRFRQTNAPVFKLGLETSGAIYNPFRGSPMSLRNRLIVLTGTDELIGNASIYADRNRVILASLCQVPAGRPTSFEEALSRINPDYLHQAHTLHAEPGRREMALAQLSHLTPENYAGLHTRFSALADDYVESMGSEGFALEEVDMAAFLINAAAIPDTARRTAKAIIEDIKSFMSEMNRLHGSCVFIFDEFGQFGSDNIAAILELGRSRQCGVVLATQDMSTLDDESFQQRVLSGCQTKILMRSDFPEALVTLAGTRWQTELGLHIQDGAYTGEGTARQQHTFKIDPNKVPQLKPGEGYIIRNRHVLQTRFRPIPPLTPVATQLAEQRSIQPQFIYREERTTARSNHQAPRPKGLPIKQHPFP